MCHFGEELRHPETYKEKMGEPILLKSQKKLYLEVLNYRLLILTVKYGHARQQIPEGGSAVREDDCESPYEHG